MKEKKEISLKKQYEFTLKMLTITMPISAVLFVIMGIVFCVKLPQIIYIGILLIAIGMFLIFELSFIKAHIKNKIDKIENELKH